MDSVHLNEETRNTEGRHFTSVSGRGENPNGALTLLNCVPFVSLSPDLKPSRVIIDKNNNTNCLLEIFIKVKMEGHQYVRR